MRAKTEADPRTEWKSAQRRYRTFGCSRPHGAPITAASCRKSTVGRHWRPPASGRLGRSYCWLDTGTRDSVLAAGQFVRTIEDRQDLRIACLEEIAFRQGFIDAAQLERLADPLKQNGYGQYRLQLLRDRETSTWRRRIRPLTASEATDRRLTQPCRGRRVPPPCSPSARRAHRRSSGDDVRCPRRGQPAVRRSEYRSASRRTR